MSVVTYEYPLAYATQNIPFYAGWDNQSMEIYQKYMNIPNPNTVFVGRLGRYRYMNMDECILDTMAVLGEKLNEDLTD